MILSETGHTAGEKLITATRQDNEKSVIELEQRGLEFIEPGEGMSDAELVELRDRAAADLIDSDYIPSAVFNRTRELLQQYRSGQTTGITNKH